MSAARGITVRLSQIRSSACPCTIARTWTHATSLAWLVLPYTQDVPFGRHAAPTPREGDSHDPTHAGPTCAEPTGAEPTSYGPTSYGPTSYGPTHHDDPPRCPRLQLHSFGRGARQPPPAHRGDRVA